jgi:hypothetical protein
VSRWDHAKLERHAINLDNGGQPLVCCWDECDRLGSTLYKHTSCLHDPRLGCARADVGTMRDAGRTAHLEYVFCSQRHRNYWVNATGRNAQESMARTGRAYGNLPVGMRKMIG